MLSGFRVCPRCHHDLPYHAGRSDQSIIAVVGISGSGKTIYLWSLLYQMREILAREERPFATAQMLIALDFYLGPVRAFAVVGDPATEDTRRVLRAINGGFRPNKVVALRPPGGARTGRGDDSPPSVVGEVREDLLPVLAGKAAVGGEVTTYVCENFACQAPLVGPEAVEAELAEA